MDLFQYKIKLKEIDTFTRIKDIESEIRSINTLLPSPWQSVRSFTESHRFLYICYTKLLTVYADKSKATLPLFCTDIVPYLSTDIFEYLETNNLLKYSTYIETFKYTKHLTLPRHNYEYLLALTKCILNKPNPYLHKLKLNYCVPSDKHGSHYSKAIYIEYLKQSLDANIRYTVIEDELDKLYTNPDLLDHKLTKDFLLDLVKAIDTYTERINNDSRTN